MSIPDTIIQQLNGSLHGQPVWGVSRGVGSFLTVELGPQQETADKDPRGAWHLWVYMADWRIEEGDRILVGSADVPEFVDEILLALGALTFESFVVDGGSGDAVLGLSNGVRLIIFASALPSDDSEAWILNQPDGSILSGGPANRWALEAAT